MSRGIARLGDSTYGVCNCHDEPITVGGKIISASEDVFVNGRGVARIGDTVMADCGHTGKIISGKEDDFVNGRSVARLGDRFTGCYDGNIISASEDTFER